MKSRSRRRARPLLARITALCLLAFALVAATAVPASAHASLVSTEPSPDGVYESSPSAITLRFSEPVDVTLGGVKVFDAKTEQRVDNGPAEHPDGDGTFVTSDLPDLDDGTYVVTWRVVSEDSHPIEGAFTFQVGPRATVDDAQGVATTLLETDKGDRAVGIVYGFQRAILYAALALLIGGVAFVAFQWPQGRANHRAAWLVLGGWLGAVIATVVGIGLEGAYGAGLSLAKALDPSVFGDVVDTRYGHVALVRLALLAVSLPLLWVVFGRKGSANRPLPPWWILPAALVAIGLSLTPGLAGHASTGIQTDLAIPLDALHVLAMAVWLGGLAVLVVALLPGRDTEEMREVLPRWSSTALGCVVVLVATGIYQSWRQVGSIDALRNTDSGRLLIAKVLVFAVLVVAAAFARDIVNRRYVEYADDDLGAGDADQAEVDVPVAVGVMASDLGPDPAGLSTRTRALPDPDEPDEDGRTEAGEQRRLRRTVWIEVLLMVAVLGVTAALVNAAPGRTRTTEPVFMTLKTDEMWFDVTIAPGSAGPNDIHVTALPTGGGLTQVKEIEVQLSQPGRDLPPFAVPMKELGANHYYAPQFDIPYPGVWKMTIRAQVSDVDEIVATGRFTLR